MTNWVVRYPRLPYINKRLLPVKETHLGYTQIKLSDTGTGIAPDIMGAKMLGRLGYKVHTSTSSLNTLESFRSRPDYFNLVITDMTMPEMTGNKLAREIIKIRSDIPIILSTGYSKKIINDHSDILGVRALIYKPIEQTEIAKTIRTVLDEAKIINW